MSPPDTSPDDEMALSQLWAYGAGVLAVAGNDTTRKTFGELGSAALAAHRQAKAEAVAAAMAKLAEEVRGLFDETDAGDTTFGPDEMWWDGEPYVRAKAVLALIEEATP